MFKNQQRRASKVRGWVVVSMAVAGSASVAWGQQDGTWINPTVGNWETTTNWAGGIIPGDGGIATFNESGGGRTITLNDGTNPTLGQININSTGVHVFTVPALALAGINMPAGGGVINAVKSPLSTPSTFDVGHQFNLTISGGSLKKIGAGTVTLGGTNAYVDGTFIEGGVLRVSTGNLGLGDATGAVTISNNAFLRISAVAMDTERTINIGVGGGTIDMFATGNIFRGPLVGSSTLTKVRGGSMLLRNANPDFTGNIVFNTGTLTLSGSQGALPVSSGLNINGTLFFDPANGNNNDRLGDTVPVVLRGSQLQMGTGTTTATTSEVIGDVTLATGSQIITALAGATGQQSLTMNSLTRQNRSTLLVRGTGLGRAPGVSVAFVGVTSAPSLVGGGGADGTTTISVLPWAVAQTDSITNTSFGVSLATIGSRGFRPLSSAEYATDLTGSASNNVRVGATTALTTLTVPGGGATVNAINVTSALAGTTVTPGTVAGTGSLTVSSGAFLVSSAGLASVSAPVVFPAGVEGVLNLYGSAATSNTFAGDSGITKAGGGAWTIVGQGNSSTYTGQTVLNGGVIRYGASVLNGQPSPFGQSSDALVLQGSTIFNVQLWATANVTVDRPLIVRGDGNGVTGLGNSSGAETVVYNGSISLERDLRLEFDPTPLATINGVISGVGGLTDAFGSGQILNGLNTFSGGINLVTGTYIAGSDSAYGTGPLFGTGSGTAVGVLSTSGGPRTLNNKLVIFNGLGFSNPDVMTFTGDVDSAGRAGPLVVFGTADLVFAGKVTNGGLDKQGTGKLVLTSNANDYLGLTVVRTGILQVGNGGTSGVLGGGGVTVAPTGTLVFNRSDSLTVANAFTGGTGTVRVNSGTVALTGPVAIGALTAAGGRAQVNAALTPQVGAISITGGGVVEATGTGGTIVASSVSVTDGFLDLNTNDMIVRGGSVPALSALVSTFLTSNGGLPGEAGLGSSEAFYTVDGEFATLAVYDNSGVGGSATFTNFNGITVAGTDVLVKYTYTGDTNLDGFVDAADMANALKGLNGMGSGWNFGDINYDGVVNFVDIGRIQAALIGQGLPLGTAAGFGGGIVLGGGGAIPEPAGLGLLLVAVPFMSRRRR